MFPRLKACGGEARSAQQGSEKESNEDTHGIDSESMWPELGKIEIEARSHGWSWEEGGVVPL